MTEPNILPQEIRDQLAKIKDDIVMGKISLLELELNPIFQKIINSVNIINIFQYSPIYRQTNAILYQKFEELKKLLIRMNNEQKYLNYLKRNPTDIEIATLFRGCWNKIFNIGSLSFKFLYESQQKLLDSRSESIIIKELTRIDSKEQFFVEIPKKKFTEKMNQYFTSIADKLPCDFGEIFENETDQLQIYEHFIYLLHLLQLGRIKYQKETRTLYI